MTQIIKLVLFYPIIWLANIWLLLLFACRISFPTAWWVQFHLKIQSIHQILSKHNFEWVGWWEWNWGITLIQTKNLILTHLYLFFQNGGPEVKKKLEEVRLLESRKSARLIGHGNTDFSKLADFNIVHERKRLNSETSDMSSGTTR